MSNLSLTGAGPETGSGAAFSPATMTGIQGWYDFSTLAGADGSAISSISDGSANARTASQATGANQPLVKAAGNGINGLKVALFDGVNDDVDTASFAVSQPFTVYAIITGGAAGGAARYFGTTAAAVRVGYDSDILSGENFAGAVLSGSNTGIATATPKVQTSVFNGVSSLIRINGAQVAAGDVGAGAVSGGITIGNNSPAGGQPWNGKIGELFWTNVASVNTAAEAYLKAKWGTP